MRKNKNGNLLTTLRALNSAEFISGFDVNMHILRNLFLQVNNIKLLSLDFTFVSLKQGTAIDYQEVVTIKRNSM